MRAAGTAAIYHVRIHGIVLVELERFLDLHHGLHHWADIRSRTGRGSAYVITEQYPDDEALGLLAAAASSVGSSPSAFQRDFGRFLAGGLAQIYSPLLEPSWTLLDVLEHTESVIHTAVRLNDATADPPHLEVRRPRPDMVEIEYRSPRRLCELAIGIIEGLARRFDKTPAITTRSCQHRGDPSCWIVVTDSDP